jgi:hypothetical protein
MHPFIVIGFSGTVLTFKVRIKLDIVLAFKELSFPAMN